MLILTLSITFFIKFDKKGVINKHNIDHAGKIQPGFRILNVVWVVKGNTFSQRIRQGIFLGEVENNSYEPPCTLTQFL